MKHNPFVPREQRTAILTFDNGQRVRAEITLPGTDKPVWHTELERRIVNDFNKAQPRAVHKLVKVHLLRTQSSQPLSSYETYNYEEENQDMAYHPSWWSDRRRITRERHE